MPSKPTTPPETRDYEVIYLEAPRGLKAALKARAKENARSLNGECIAILRRAVGGQEGYRIL